MSHNFLLNISMMKTLKDVIYTNPDLEDIKRLRREKTPFMQEMKLFIVVLSEVLKDFPQLDLIWTRRTKIICILAKLLYHLAYLGVRTILEDPQEARYVLFER